MKQCLSPAGGKASLPDLGTVDRDSLITSSRAPQQPLNTGSDILSSPSQDLTEPNRLTLCLNDTQHS